MTPELTAFLRRKYKVRRFGEDHVFLVDTPANTSSPSQKGYTG
jgi:hypothetical protein